MISRPQTNTGTHDLHPPPWLTAMYSAFAAPFIILAALAPLALYLWARDSGIRSLVNTAIDSPLKANVLLWTIGGILLCGIAAFATILLFARHARRTQRTRNKFATESGGQAREPFVLYLRPFVEDRRSFVPNSFGDTARFMYGTSIPLEVSLSLALHPDHHLVAIGDKFGSLGADKISVSDATWFDTVKTLAKSADALIMIPGYRNSTAQEIDFLFASPDLLAKTIFILIGFFIIAIFAGSWLLN